MEHSRFLLAVENYFLTIHDRVFLPRPVFTRFLPGPFPFPACVKEDGRICRDAFMEKNRIRKDSPPAG